MPRSPRTGRIEHLPLIALASSILNLPPIVRKESLCRKTLLAKTPSIEGFPLNGVFLRNLAMGLPDSQDGMSAQGPRLGSSGADEGASETMIRPFGQVVIQRVHIWRIQMVKAHWSELMWQTERTRQPVHRDRRVQSESSRHELSRIAMNTVDDHVRVQPGDTVKFLAPLTEEEAAERFVIVEDRGSRVLVEAVCDMRIRPTFVYRVEELIRA